jgi:hypothetical protein
MPRTKDLSNQRFGHLIALYRAAKPEGLNSTEAFWQCKCDCGRETVVSSHKLRKGKTQSCNCSFAHDWCRTHGKANSREYIMWNAAKGRAKKDNLPFDLSPEDIVIPDKCPVLGIPLFSNVGKLGSIPNSPTIDKIIPAKGYVKGNFRVICHRANTIKNDATLAELEAVTQYVREISCG